jgi:hypothetical protein
MHYSKTIFKNLAYLAIAILVITAFSDSLHAITVNEMKTAFQAAKKYPKECRQTRIDIEKRMCRVLAEWKGAK